ncbi:peptidase M23 [Serinicoccus sediminis]|uniref:CIS tube protein n=1 Tax=Serinicoccus sediminis TaxID=2306021 RepID=UPI00102130B1|nr:peptidase M23 [Serinicoccus sediminis]
MISGLVTVSVPAPALSAVAGARSEKATLSLRDDDTQVLHCQFNPTEYTITKTARWTRVPVRGAASAAPPEFVGTNAGSMQVELFFDSREAGIGSVVESVSRLLSWTQPSPRSIEDRRPSPPVVIFEWGGSAVFHAYVSSAAARFVLFNRDGTPIRAHVSLRLEEVPRPQPGTNPTSSGTSVVRRHHFVAGDSLPLLAHREYGRADRWRAIAAASGIDDPTRVRPGTSLLVPDLTADPPRRSS